MNKKLIIGLIILIIGLGAAGYFYYKNIQKTPAEKAIDLMSKAVDASTKGVLPEINPGAESLGENIQDVNPVNKINPFKGIYTNPFGTN